MLKNIQGVTPGSAKSSSQSSEQKPELQRARALNASGGQQVPADRVTLGSAEASLLTYGREVSGEVMSESFGLLRDLVARTLQEQGATFRLTINGVEKGIEDLTQDEARELIAEDGYFGVEQTSERIVEFAIGMAGGDPGRLDAILQGIDQGFREAEKAFGGTLPEISYQTYDAIRQKLDQWRENAL